MRKIIIVVAAIVLIVVVAAVVYLLTNINSLVANAIEKHGSAVTETRVRVAGVEIALRQGRGTIKGLRVANPNGFKAGDAFTLGDITADIDVKSVRSNPITLDEIRIQAPIVSAEITKSGRSNIDELRKRVQAHTGQKAKDGGDAKGKTRRMRIKRFVFEKGRVEIDASALGLEKQTITLPEIQLSDVGGKNGAPPDEIAKIILAALVKKVTSEIANSELDGLIKKKLQGSVTDKTKSLLKKIWK